MIEFILGYVFGYLDGRHSTFLDRALGCFFEYFLFPVLGFVIAQAAFMYAHNTLDFGWIWGAIGWALGVVLQLVGLYLLRNKARNYRLKPPMTRLKSPTTR